MKNRLFCILLTVVTLQSSLVVNANSVMIQQTNTGNASQIAVEEFQQLSPYPKIGRELSREERRQKKLNEDGAYGTYVCEHDVSKAPIKAMKAKDRLFITADFSQSRIYEYVFECRRTGFHTFSVDEDVYPEVKADLSVFDQNGERILHAGDMEATSSVGCPFKAGERYSIRIEAEKESADGTFNIFLTISNDAMILYPGTRIKDSFTAPGQVNGYFFVPQETGLYRFFFESIDEGMDLDLRMGEFPSFKLDTTTYHAWEVFNHFWN